MVVMIGPTPSSGPCHPVFLQVEHSKIVEGLIAEVSGDLTQSAPWAVLSFVVSAVRRVIRQFSGLPSDAFLTCPKHHEVPMYLSEVSLA